MKNLMETGDRSVRELMPQPISDICYRAALEQLGYMLFDFDMECRRIIFSGETAKKYRLPAFVDSSTEALVRSGYIHPCSADILVDMFDEIQSGKTLSRGNVQLSLGNGQFFWCECTFIAFHNVRHILIVVKNINKQYEKELKMLKERQYHQAILSSAIQIYKVNISRNLIIDGHQNWNERFGIEPLPCYSDMLKLVTDKAIHPDDSRRIAEGLSQKNVLTAFQRGQSEIVLECRRAELGKQYIWIKCTMCLLRDPDAGGIMGIIAIKNIESRKRREAEMQYLAERDSLCKIYNHGATRQHIVKFLESEEGRSNLHALLILDIDNFKRINDTHGHLNGDTMLSKIATIMQDIFRSTDIIGRVGGDEFLLFLKNISNSEKAVRKAAEVNQVIQSLQISGNPGLSVSVSIGISICPYNGTTFNELFFKADTALYQAKRKGKNTYVLYQDDEQTKR